MTELMRDLELAGANDVLESVPSLSGDIRFLWDYFLPAHGRYRGERYRDLLGRLPAASEDPETLAARGRLRRLLGHDAAAQADWKEARALDPRCAPALAFLSEMRLARDPASARRGLERACAQRPEELPYKVWLAYALFVSGDSAAARTFLERLDMPARRSGSGRLLRGLLRERSGDLRGAEDDFTAVCRVNPRCPGIYTLRATVLRKAGRLGEAVEDAHRALLSHPENLDAFVRILYIGEGVTAPQNSVLEREVLTSAISRLLKEHRDWAWLHAAQAGVLGDSRLQIEPLRQSLRLEGNRAWVRAFLARALSDDRVGRPAEGLPEIDAALKLAPGAGWIWSWRAEILRKLGRQAQAVKSLDRGIVQAPDYPLAYAWRSALLEARGDLAGAVEDISACLTVLDRPSFYHRRALMEWNSAEPTLRPLEDLSRCVRLQPALAWAYAGLKPLAVGNLPPLLDISPFRLEALSARFPGEPLVLAWLGRSLLNAGRFQEAENALDRCLHSDSACAPAWCWRGESRFRRHSYAAALHDHERALALEPGWLVAGLWRAADLLALGRAEQGLGLLLELSRGPQGTHVAAWIKEVALDFRKIKPSDSVSARLSRAELLLRMGEAAAVLKSLAAPRAKLGAAGGLLRALALGLEGRCLEADRGLRLAARLDPEGSAKRLSEFLGATPLPAGLGAGVYFSLWRAQKGRGRLEEGVAARALGRRVWEGGPEAPASAASAYPSAWVLRSEAERLEGRLEEAARSAGEALRLDARFAEAHAARASARGLLGDHAGALEDLRRARSLSPRDPDILAAQADVLRALGKNREALACLAPALRLDPHHPLSRILRGELLRARGDNARAWSDIRRAVERDFNGFCPADILGREPSSVAGDPRYAWAYAWRGGINRRLQRWEEARSDLDRALALDPSCFWASAWRGELKLAMGNAAGALADLGDALKIHPRFVEALSWRGRVRCGSGHCQEAMADFQRALSLDPDHVWSLVGAAACMERRGRLRQARSSLRKARELAPSLFEGSALD